jgi:hypothetical protein
MKVPLSCPECVKMARDGKLKWTDLTPVIQPLADSGEYPFTCQRGHKVVVIRPEPKWETLCRSGVFALIDGYPREVIAAFAAAVERFHEFVLRVLLRSRHVEAKEVEAVWKLVKGQSERQLGAFMYLYLADTGKRPPDPPDSTFRNSVIHKGLVPTIEEGRKYAETSFNYIMAILRTMIERHPNEAGEELEEHSRILVSKHNLNPMMDFANQTWATHMSWHARRKPEEDDFSLATWMKEMSDIFVPSRFKTRDELDAETPDQSKK